MTLELKDCNSGAAIERLSIRIVGLVVKQVWNYRIECQCHKSWQQINYVTKKGGACTRKKKCGWFFIFYTMDQDIHLELINLVIEI